MVWHWNNNPRNTSHVYGQLIYHKVDKNIYNVQRAVSSITLLQKLDSHMEKNEVRLLSYTTDKNHLNIEWRLERYPWNHPVPRKKTQVIRSLMTVLAMICLDLNLKAKATKAKRNKWNYIKLKSFCTASETTNKMKRQLWMGENICKLYILWGLISKIYKEHIQLNSRQNKAKNQIREWEEDMNRHLSKEDM